MTQINTDPVKIREILTRGVYEVVTQKELEQKLLSGKQLHLKLGTDVTGPMLHLGHLSLRPLVDQALEAIPVQELVVALAPGYIMVVLEAVQVSILANQADPMSKVQQVVAVGRGIMDPL